MEQSPQPQIQEQEADGNESSASHQENIPIAEAAKTKLTSQLVGLLQDIKSSQNDGSRSPEDAAKATDQLSKLSIDLVGLDAERLGLLAFEERVLGKLQELIGEEPTANTIIGVAQSLVGFDSPEAWDLRREIQRLLPKSEKWILQGLAGVNSDQAWKYREEFMADERFNQDNAEFVIQSLAGLDDERAWTVRERLVKEFPGTASIADISNHVLSNLTGLDSDKAWQFREALHNNDTNSDDLLTGLGGINSKRASEMRGKKFARFVHHSSRLDGWCGIDTEESWQFRDYLMEGDGEIPDAPSIDRSLAGIDSERAWALRITLLDRTDEHNPWDMGRGLAGIDSDRADEMRERLRVGAEDVLGTVALSYNGDYFTGIGWRAARGLLPYQLEQKKAQNA